MELSVLIVSYNTCELLRNCLQSACSTLTTSSYEILVVDNASADNSVEMIETEFNQVSLIKNPQNIGFAAANNQAIRASKGRYLLLLNSDALLKSSAIEELIRFMDSHPAAAAAGPRVLNVDGSLQSKGFNFPSIVLSILDLVRVTTFLSAESLCRLFSTYFWDENAVRPVDWISGSCMLMRRNAVDRIGYLSEEFFMYYEDVEWCRRAWNRGYEIWYCGHAEVIHNNLASPFPDRVNQIRLAAGTYYKITDGRLKGVIISLMRIMFYGTRLLRALALSGITHESRSARESLKDEIGFLLFLINKASK